MDWWTIEILWRLASIEPKRNFWQISPQWHGAQLLHTDSCSQTKPSFTSRPCVRIKILKTVIYRSLQQIWMLITDPTVTWINIKQVETFVLAWVISSNFAGVENPFFESEFLGILALQNRLCESLWAEIKRIKQKFCDFDKWSTLFQIDKQAIYKISIIAFQMLP